MATGKQEHRIARASETLRRIKQLLDAKPRDTQLIARRNRVMAYKRLLQDELYLVEQLGDLR